MFITLSGNFLNRFAEATGIKDKVEKLVDSVMHIYNSSKKNLLPTPKKSHYTFNLRDISKVF